MIFLIHKKKQQIETEPQKTPEKEKYKLQSLLNGNHSEHIVKDLECVSKTTKKINDEKV